jgi:hypothetical protein
LFEEEPRDFRSEALLLNVTEKLAFVGVFEDSVNFLPEEKEGRREGEGTKEGRKEGRKERKKERKKEWKEGRKEGRRGMSKTENRQNREIRRDRQHR